MTNGSRKSERALVAGGGAGGVTFLLSSLFPNFNILQPFNPDPSNGSRPPPDVSTRIEWSLLIGGIAAVIAYYAS
jgi:hypothetical protein